MRKITITVAGEVGSGKSNIASLVAQYLSTVLGPDKVKYKDEDRTEMDQMGVYATMPKVAEGMRNYVGPIEIVTRHLSRQEIQKQREEFLAQFEEKLGEMDKAVSDE